MSEWVNCKLGDLFDQLVNGGTPSTANPAFWNGTTPWVTGADFTKNGIGEIRRFVSDLGIRSSSTTVVAPGKLLVVTRTGVGKLAISKEPIAISQDITGVYPDTKKADILFLFYLLSRELEELKKLNQGTSINGIVRGDFLRHPIFVPKQTPTQQKIARILQTVDRAMEKTEALIEKYQQIKAGLMHDLFTRGLWTQEELDRGDHQGTPAAATAKPGQLRPTRQDAPHLYQQTPIGWIPKVWKVKQLGECVSFIGGSGFPEILQGQRTGPIPFFKVSDQSLSGNDRYLYLANNYVSYELASRMGWRLAPEGGIAFAKVGAALLLNRRRILTRVSLVDNNMMVAVAREELNRDWLFCWFVRVDLRNLVQLGALPSVNQAQLSALQCGFPSAEEQNYVTQAIQSIDSMVDAEAILLQKLRKQKSGLMHDLLTGKVPVTPDPEEAGDS